MITIFTPTYNRAYILPVLFKSLQNQTTKDFEWIIVDDGSTDNTNQVVDSFIENSDFKIHYFKKNNQGKHIAINYGVKKAKGDLFFIVDSDDYIAKNTIQFLLDKYKIIHNQPDVAGVALGYYSIKKNHRLYSKKLPDEEILLTYNELVYKYNILGDFATAFKTSIQRVYPYPHFENEFFFRESYVYRKIGRKYKTLYIDSKYYFADYLEDGLTAKSWRLLKKSPKGAALFYKELSKEQIPLKNKLAALNAYWDFQLNDIQSSWVNKFNGVSFFYSIFILFNRKFKFFNI